ncbi:MAG: hypothetical protein IIB40_05300 [Candidatus Marinimicrobia bacterium]|nr:hypothetical protein [Candidatus Neomarinimicrobiota bacterium]
MDKMGKRAEEKTGLIKRPLYKSNMEKADIVCHPEWYKKSQSTATLSSLFSL